MPNFNPHERRLLATTMGFGALPMLQSPQPQQSLQQLLQQLQQQPQEPPALLPQQALQQQGQQQQRFDASAADLALPGRDLLGNTPAGPPMPPPGFMESLPPSRSDRGDRLADQVNTLLTGLGKQRTPSFWDIEGAKGDASLAQRNLRASRGPRTRPTVSQEFDSLQAVYDPSGRRTSGLPDQTRVSLVRNTPRLDAEFFRRMLEKDRQEERDSTARWEAGKQAEADRFNSPGNQAKLRRLHALVARRRAAGDLKPATPAMLQRRVEVRARRKSELAQRRANVTARAMARRGMVSMDPAAQMQRMMQTNPELIFQLAQLNQQGQQFQSTNQLAMMRMAQQGQQFQGTRQDAANALMGQMQQMRTDDSLKRYGLELGDTTENRGMDIDQAAAQDTLRATMTAEEWDEYEASVNPTESRAANLAQPGYGFVGYNPRVHRRRFTGGR